MTEPPCYSPMTEPPCYICDHPRLAPCHNETEYGHDFIASPAVREAVRANLRGPEVTGTKDPMQAARREVVEAVQSGDETALDKALSEYALAYQGIGDGSR